jgi:hypothetical protein
MERAGSATRPVVSEDVGAGIWFFESVGRDVPLHLAEVKAYRSGMVALRYEVSGSSAMRTPGGYA